MSCVGQALRVIAQPEGQRVKSKGKISWGDQWKVESKDGEM
jgi:hypothetical protein